MRLSDISSCLDYLKSKDIEYLMHKHDRVSNMVEMSEKVKLEKSPLIKNLF